ncbi:MAG: anthranilate phosphoribosyltransferase, partial [Deltaproteobacteria bacterium CG_4_8_14_3_um_filter_51_11]
MAFFYPPVSSGPMGKIAQVRQEIGIRTLLNLVGPLCNPADAAIQMVGVYRPELTEKTALSLKRLGTKAAMAVHGEGALDEISICGRSTISRLSGGEISSFDLTPEEVGLKRASIEDVAGGN